MDANTKVLDPVPQEPADVKSMVQVYARKKALVGAGTVLLTGVERLRTCHSEVQRNSRNTPDFHIELLRYYRINCCCKI